MIATRTDRGLFENRLELLFEIPSQCKQFAITRTITARVGIMVPPHVLAKFKWARRLQAYPAPPDLENLAFKKDLKTDEKVIIVRKSFMPGTFGIKTYSKHMQTMLWIEEEQARLALPTHCNT